MNAVTARKPMNDFVFATIVAGLLLMVLALPVALGAFAAGSLNAEEDTARVWVCAIQGNGTCGPDEPWIKFNDVR